MLHLGSSLAGVWQVRLLATSEAAGQRPGSNTHISQGGLYLLCISTVSTLYLFCIYFVHLHATRIFFAYLLCISTASSLYIYCNFVYLLSTVSMSTIYRRLGDTESWRRMCGAEPASPRPASSWYSDIGWDGHIAIVNIKL